MVEVRQDPYRTHRRQATVDNLIQNDFLAIATTLDTDFIQHQQIDFAEVTQQCGL